MRTCFEKHSTNYKDEWLTPPEIIKELGRFDLDPCSPIDTPFKIAKNVYTIEDNGLRQEWFGRVWCNPPYSYIQQWMRKNAQHNNSIMLTFARTDTQNFKYFVWEKAASIFFCEGRLHFHSLDGSNVNPGAGAPSCLIAYGKNNAEILQECNIPGKHIWIDQRTFIFIGMTETWFKVVSMTVNRYGDNLNLVYKMVEKIAPGKVLKNKHWKAKIRQQIQIIRKK